MNSLQQIKTIQKEKQVAKQNIADQLTQLRKKKEENKITLTIRNDKKPKKQAPKKEPTVQNKESLQNKDTLQKLLALKNKNLSDNNKKDTE